MNTAEVAGPGPSLVGRKVSAAFSETDSGVDVETEGEESLEAREEKRVIRPSDEVISRLCNFDEEEEELTDTESDEADSEAEDTVRLSLMELKHIMSALVHEYVEAGPGGGAILAGSRCAVCRQAIFSLWLGTGARCGVCSFLVCRHCSTQAASLCPETELRVPVDLLTPASVAEASRRHAASSFSPLSAASLAAQEPGPGSLGWQLASSAVSRVRRWSQASAAQPGLASLCCTCARILAQAV